MHFILVFLTCIPIHLYLAIVKVVSLVCMCIYGPKCLTVEWHIAISVHGGMNPPHLLMMHYDTSKATKFGRN